MTNQIKHILSTREQRTIRAFAEVFIEGCEEAIGPDEIMRNIDTYLAGVRSSRTSSLRLILFIVEHVLPRIWWPLRPSFSNLSLSDRKRLIQERLQNPRLPRLFRDLARVKSLFIIGYYGDARVYDSINFIPVNERVQFQPNMLKTVGLPHLELTTPTESEISCDVCIIGSGAGGAVVAHNMAAAGSDVVLLEEGPYALPDELVHSEAVIMPRLYKEGGLQATVDQDMMILQGKVLGGTTTLNNAICFRLNDPGITADKGPDLFDRWAELGAHIDRIDLNTAYDRVEKMISVQPLLQSQEQEVPDIDGNNARILLAGWNKLAAENPDLNQYKSGLFRKIYKRCLGCGYCNFGCPYERKMGMAETYIPSAISKGAQVISNCHAVKIEREGSTASGVRCEMSDGRSLYVKAKTIVISCGAIGSSVLLMKSGFKRNVGSRFSFNAGLPVFALFPEPLSSFEGVQMAAYIDTNDYLIESLFYPPMAFATPLPGWFEIHFERMKAYNRFASAGVLVGTEANGQVKRNGWLRKYFGPVDYQMTDNDMSKMKRGIAKTAEIYFAAGADQLFPASFVPCEMSAVDFAGRPDKIFSFIDEKIRRPDDLTLGSAHPQGGNPMSDDPAIGVIDSQFRVHGCTNLYVCDASIFPSTIRINPQLTIMAMADYFSNRLMI